MKFIITMVINNEKLFLCFPYFYQVPACPKVIAEMPEARQMEIVPRVRLRPKLSVINLV
jgi:hypothetical protein